MAMMTARATPAQEQVATSTKSELRFLSLEEIDQIAADFESGMPNAMFTTVKDFSVKQYIDTLRTLLLFEKIRPEKIPDLARILKNEGQRSLVQSGNPIGLSISESNGQPATQMTLNTFHQAGQLGAEPIDNFRAILNLTKNRNGTFTHLHFKNKKMDFDDVLDHRQYYVSHNLSSLILNTDILTLPPICVKSLHSSRENIEVNDDVIKILDNLNQINFLKDKIQVLTEKIDASGDSNSKKMTGMSSAELEDIRELILDQKRETDRKSKTAYKDAIEESTQQTSKAHKKLMSSQDVLDLQLEFIDTKILHSSLVKKYSKYSHYLNMEERFVIDEKIAKETDRSYYLYHANELIENATSSKFLRIEFDVVKLYAYRITIGDIMRILTNKFGNNYVYIPSPTVLGKIDIYPILDRVSQILKGLSSVASISDEDDLSMVISYALNDTIITKLQENYIGGVKEITDMIPMLTKTISVFNKKSVEHFEYDTQHTEIRNQWRMYIKPAKYRLCGFTLENKIKTMLSECGIKFIRDHTQERDTGGFNNYIVVESDENPITKCNRLYSEETDKRQQVYKESKGIYTSSLLKSFEYYYAQLAGTNLKKILVLPYTDTRYTICNDFHQLEEVRGIQVVETWIDLEFNNLFENAKQNVAKRHIAELPRLMTFMGVLSSITSRGAAMFNRGVFADASFEQAAQAIRNVTPFSKKEKISSVSTSILTGNRCKIGTGSFEIIVNVPDQEFEIENKIEFNSTQPISKTTQQQQQKRTSGLPETTAPANEVDNYYLDENDEDDEMANFDDDDIDI